MYPNSGRKETRVDRVLHNLSGPAVLIRFDDGSCHDEYWIRGVRYSKETWKKIRVKMLTSRKK